jgi:hypothetical protein
MNTPPYGVPFLWRYRELSLMPDAKRLDTRVAIIAEFAMG